MSESADRKARNTQIDVAGIQRATAALAKWPTLTTINNVRLALSAFEEDIKNGDAVIAIAQPGPSIDELAEALRALYEATPDNEGVKLGEACRLARAALAAYEASK